MRSTTFGEINSATELHLIQQSVSVKPAPIKSDYLDIPGSDGSIDKTEALGVGILYGDREIEWTYALHSGDNLEAKRRQVSNAINGLRCQIFISDDPDRYYEGRVEVSDYNSDGIIKQINIKATCSPWCYKKEITTVEDTNLTTEYKEIVLQNDRRRVIPTITVNQKTMLMWDTSVFSLNQGTHRILDIMLHSGENILKAKVDDGTGSITISYREAGL